MFVLKLFLIILQFSQVSLSRVRIQDLEPYSRYKGVKCHSSNITLSFYKCFIKANSRKNTTYNIFVNISRPIYSANLHFDFRYRSISNSQRSIINSTFEICSILNGTESNVLFKWIIGQMPNLVQLLHPCPYQVPKFYVLL